MGPERNWRAMQMVLALVLFATALRVYFIYRSRHEAPPAPVAAPALSSDDYVVPKKVHAYNLKSARVLVGSAVWVKAGYGVAYYPYNATAKRADFTHEAGLLTPIQKLEITDVLMQSVPSNPQWHSGASGPFRIHPDTREVLAAFSQEGKDFVFPIGSYENGDYHFMLDDLLFIQDPRQLYHEWPTAVWQAIGDHQVMPGMDELQVSFAIGVPESVQEQGEQRLVTYDNGGHPLVITFATGRVLSVAPSAGH